MANSFIFIFMIPIFSLATDVCSLPVGSGPYGCEPGPCSYRVPATGTLMIPLYRIPFTVERPSDTCIQADVSKVYDVSRLPLFSASNEGAHGSQEQTRLSDQNPEGSKSTGQSLPNWITYIPSPKKIGHDAKLEITYSRWIAQTNPTPPVNCVGHWSACNPSTGIQIFLITTPKAGSGANCPFAAGTPRNCSVDCIGNWDSCVSGTQTFQITQKALNGGAACNPSVETSRTCNAACGLANGITTAIMPSVGLCTRGNSTGVISLANSWNWGCFAQDGSNASCSADSIKVDCVGAWGACNQSTGKQIYTISVPKVGSGANCPFGSGDLQDCAVDCVGSWNSCTNGTQAFQITQIALNGGASCSKTAGDSRTCQALCGSANGATTVTAPSTGLCANGTPSLISAAGPTQWSWNCSADDGTNSACNSNKTAVVTLTCNGGYSMMCGSMGCTNAAWNKFKAAVLDLQSQGVNIGNVLTDADNWITPGTPTKYGGKACNRNSGPTAFIGNSSSQLNYKFTMEGTSDAFPGPINVTQKACEVSFSFKASGAKTCPAGSVAVAAPPPPLPACNKWTFEVCRNSNNESSSGPIITGDAAACSASRQAYSSKTFHVCGACDCLY